MPRITNIRSYDSNSMSGAAAKGLAVEGRNREIAGVAPSSFLADGNDSYSLGDVSDMSPQLQSLKRCEIFYVLNLEQPLCSPALGSS